MSAVIRAGKEHMHVPLEGRQEKMSGPSLGNGPPWSLVLHQDNTTEPGVQCLRRCRQLLEQALSESELAEVRFVFDDGKSGLHGHWAMLCEVCQVFRQMKQIGMEEGKKNEVRIVGISRQSFRGFLEWLYTGVPGNEMAGADGREVWLLAERYQIDGIKEWLMETCLREHGSICAAVQYAVEGDGEGRDDILNACRKKGITSVVKCISDERLQGMSCAVLREVLLVHARVDRGSNVRAIARFRLFERWAKLHVIEAYVQLDQEGKIGMNGLIEAVDLDHLPVAFLSDVVKESGLVSVEHVVAALDRRQDQDEGIIGNADYQIVRRLEYGRFGHPSCMAVSMEWEGQRLAVAFTKNLCLFDVESGTCIAKVGCEGGETGQIGRVTGIAFNKEGELIVSDYSNNAIHALDRHGVHVRRFGCRGQGDGQLRGASGVAVNKEGDILVCDDYNHRVQIFRQDGTFVSKFGEQGKNDGQFQHPVWIAVGIHGHIVVRDSSVFVQVFDPCGKFLTKVCPSYGYEMGVDFNLSFAAGNQFVVGSKLAGSLQVFNTDGSYVRYIRQSSRNHEDLDTGVAAVDAQARIYVVQAQAYYKHYYDECRVVILAPEDKA